MKLTLETKGLNIVDLAARNFPAIALRSLNRTAEQVKTQAGKLVRERYNLTAAEVSKEIKLRPATPGNLVAVIWARTRRFTLARFSSAQKKAGVAVTIVRGQRKTIRGSFIATPPKTGQPIVFRREGKARLPIKALRTISLSAMMKSMHVFRKAKEFFAIKLPEVITREVKYYLFKNS